MTQFPEVLMHHNVEKMAIFTGDSTSDLQARLREVSATRDMLVVKSCGTIIRIERKQADHIRWLAKQRRKSVSEMVRDWFRSGY